MIQNARLSDVRVGGDLLRRVTMNFDRLEEEQYQPSRLYEDPAFEWPGDHEGRTMLALVLLAQAAHREPKWLGEIFARLPGHLNEHGYFGTILPEGTMDEQQLSGNSWFLRALLEYYAWKREAGTLAGIEKLVRHLLLPARGRYAEYPIDAELRNKNEGEAAGQRSGKTEKGWVLSTDTGCAFIMLDGASQAYELLRWPELKELLEEMTARFMQLDPVRLSCQTHATLSALRGVMRYSRAAGDAEKAAFVQQRFGLYLSEAATANLANFNWFGRPTWTEPCAIVDSFQLSVELWKQTGRAEYLDLAHEIYYSAVCHAQRPNGGFGCDCCAGAQDEFLYPLADIFEAHWCCTMRGGEGLSRAAENICSTDEEDVFVAFYHPSEARVNVRSGSVALKMSTQYPTEGKVLLEVAGESAGQATLKLYVPGWADGSNLRLTRNGERLSAAPQGGFVAVPCAPHDRIELAFDIPLREKRAGKTCKDPEGIEFFHGPALLGADNAGEPLALSGRRPLALGAGGYALGGAELQPVGRLTGYPEEKARASRMQVLFKP